MMHVIEYQHRGMPHAHIVVKLSNMPGMCSLRGTTFYESCDLISYVDTNVMCYTM
jgi:hypothetical protein